ncbi:MAG: hypothetical protein KDB80_18090 [Planctomycetes bacterium]|nr:hypothetical protein [Planctomycetota bacterium]
MLIPDDYVELTTAKSQFEAKILLAVLQDADIPAIGESDSLQDEFATSQRLMNAAGGRVFVPSNRVADAERVLLEAREAGERLAEEFPDDGPTETEPRDGRPGSPALAPKFAWLFAVSTAVLFFAWTHDRERLVQYEASDPVFETEFIEQDLQSVIVERWRSDGSTARRGVDRRSDGYRESWTEYDRSGRPVARWVDDDEDGVFESGEMFDVSGRQSAHYRDRDQDGRLDEFEVRFADGTKLVLHDADGDAFWEIRECFDADGNRTARLEDRGVEGLVRVE